MKECAGRGDRTQGCLHAKRTRFRSSYRAAIRCVHKYETTVENLSSANIFNLNIKLGIHMQVCVCVCIYRKYQNTKINREGILMYGYMCIYAWYSNALKLYAARGMTYTLTRIWIPSLRCRNAFCSQSKSCNIPMSYLISIYWSLAGQVIPKDQ